MEHNTVVHYNAKSSGGDSAVLLRAAERIQEERETGIGQRDALQHFP
jgi:hypothetical protein